MQLKWGSQYTFQDSACSISTHFETRINDGGQPVAIMKSFDVDGYIYGASQSQASVTAEMLTLEAALRTPYQDLILYQSDSAQSATILQNSSSITGTKVTRGPIYPDSLGWEYVGGRRVLFTVEAEYPLSGTTNFLLRFRESLTFWGGGPLFTVQPAIFGPAQRQMTYASTAFYAEQAGEVVGYRQYPDSSVPPPIWPDFMVQLNPRATRGSPRRRGNGYDEFPISWQYSFIGTLPFFGVPNLWIS